MAGFHKRHRTRQSGLNDGKLDLHGVQPHQPPRSAVVTTTAKEVPPSQPTTGTPPSCRGDVVIVRYYDALLFKDALSSGLLRPVVRETVGWLDYEDKDYIRLVWERYAEPVLGEESRFRTTGLAIRKADIIEIRRLSSP